jgi:protein-tyrosine-phosphatase
MKKTKNKNSKLKSKITKPKLTNKNKSKTKIKTNSVIIKKTAPKKIALKSKVVQKEKKPELPVKKVIENKIKPVLPKLTNENQMNSNMTIIPNKPYFTILFVCTGNMCRSPIAEGIMKKKIENEIKGEEKDYITVHSCGTYAYEGNKPSESAIKISKQNNIDIGHIRSKAVNKLIIEESDIIFTLSVEHLNFIHENFLSAKNKTFLLKMFGENRLAQMADSIPDPMGFTIEYYVKTYNEIKNAIDKIFPAIKEMITKKMQIKP